jgi:drug/metabolite transporter (DMT)-like permease
LATASLIIFNSFLFLLATLPYFHALQKDEASIVVPLWQMIPVISFVINYLVLGETLTMIQMAGGILVMLGAIGISLELSPGNLVKFKTHVFWLMLLSSILFSLNFAFFKLFAISSSFWTTSFWEYTGFALFGVLLLTFVTPYRKEFMSVVAQNKIPVLSINGINEVINILAKLAFNFASLLAPITLVFLVNGLQPFFVFFYGLILTLFFPHISQEKISRRHIVQKLIAIIIMFFGTYLIKKNY